MLKVFDKQHVYLRGAYFQLRRDIGDRTAAQPDERSTINDEASI